MKELFKKLTVWMLSFLLTLSSLPPSPVQAAAKNRSANIYSFTGTVSVKRGSDKTLNAFEGMRLETGDIIITGSNSSAVITIDSDKSITVDSNTEIALDELSGTAQKSKTGTSLFSGNVVNSVKEKLTDGSTYETKTSNSIMGVRGTSYLVGQDTTGVRLLVSSGAVACEAQTDPVVVLAGTGTTSSGKQGVANPHAISAKDVLSLPPVAAREFLTDTLFSSITDKPANLTSLDQLLENLEKQETQRLQKVQEQITLREETLSQQAIQEPEPFFSNPAHKLTGTTNQLLLSQQTKPATEETTLPEQASPNGLQPSPLPALLPDEAPAPPRNDPSLPQSQPTPPAQTPGGGDSQVDTDTPGQPGTGTPGDPGTGTPGDPGTGTPGDPGTGTPGDPGTGTPGDPGGGDSGGDDSGGDSGKPGTGKPDPKPELSVGELTQEAIYEKEESGKVDPNRFYGMTVTWNKLPDASDYQIQLQKEGGTAHTFYYSEQPMESEGKCKLLLPAQTQSQYHNSVLTITPVTSGEKTPTPSSIQLNYTLAPSSVSHRLRAPGLSNVSLSYTEAKLSFRFHVTGAGSPYRVLVYMDDPTQPAYAQELTEDQTVNTITMERDNFTGATQIGIQALGDDFTIFSSEIVTSAQFEISKKVKLETPAAIFIKSGNMYQIQWPAVESASKYEIMFQNEFGVSYLGQGTIHMAGNSIIYDLKPNDLEHLTLVKIRAVSNRADHEDSDWSVVEIPELYPTAARMASPSNAMLASPSNAQPQSSPSHDAAQTQQCSFKMPELDLGDGPIWKEED